MTYKPLILVAEDEKPIGTLLKYNLEQADFRVVIATDGQQALKFAAQEKPDLVLLDWMLPIVTGIEVCRQLRAQTTTALTPIIMVTARGEEAERIRGLDTGADDYVVKPFSPAELIARIK
jgi:two-component system phosphate regulon response regulator PhoB